MTQTRGIVVLVLSSSAKKYVWKHLSPRIFNRTTQKKTNYFTLIFSDIARPVKKTTRFGETSEGKKFRQNVWRVSERSRQLEQRGGCNFVSLLSRAAALGCSIFLFLPPTAAKSCSRRISCFCRIGHFRQEQPLPLATEEDLHSHASRLLFMEAGAVQRPPAPSCVFSAK